MQLLQLPPCRLCQFQTRSRSRHVTAPPSETRPDAPRWYPAWL